ncbi:MAG: ArnT family glycosyltransferase [Thermoanaerobaculia bacterium]
MPEVPTIEDASSGEEAREQRLTRPELRGLALLVAAWLLFQIPFLSTAFRVDEPNIIRIAERAAVAPSDPYGFRINWGGIDEDAFPILANPPLVPYWLAAWGSTLGWTETVLHASMLPFSVLALAAFAFLAKALEVRPLVATLLLAASPAFVLGSQVVMPDVAMIAFFITAIACALGYLKGGPAWLIPLGFAAGALAPLAKYNGALVGPLLGLLWLYGRGRRSGLFVIAAGPAIGLGGWSVVNLMTYGRTHIQTIAEFESGGTVVILSAILGYIGFGLLPAVLAISAAPVEMPGRVLHAVTAVMGLMMAISMFLLFDVGPWAAAGYGLSVAISCRFLVTTCVLAWRGAHARDAVTVLLVIWIALGLWFQFGLLFASVRYLLPILPAALLLVLRADLLPVGKPWFRAGLAASLALTASVAIGDAKTANLYRQFVDEVVVPRKAAIGGRLLFDGHWGFQYYMEREGGKILNYFRQPRWRAGDVIFIARNPFPSYQDLTPTGALAIRSEEIVVSPSWPVRTIDCGAFANFYGPGVMECKGPVLPFGFSTKARDAFAVMTVTPRGEVSAP